MKEIIKINTNENDITLSGRELHEFLDIGTEYPKWFERMTEYGFTKGEDYLVHYYDKNSSEVKNDDAEKMSANQRSAKGIIINHEIKLDMAKEIAMIQRNEKGKQARKYFLEVEKAWNSPEMIMKRALEIANKRVENLQLENTQQKQIIGELKPKADYTDIILKNKGLVTITQIAKDYGLSGQALNDKLHELKIQYKIGEQWLLYSKYHAKGYTHSETIPITRKNGMKDVNMITKWTQKGRLFIYELLKKNNILPLIESEEF
ncbi:phage antirepressor KilAC domain-containing protein [Clostridium sp.]|nr:phage antirepressor KilAC domain-containing protein [Clostridium sp.]MDU3527077.1 phage antirepressor KilAC domain-containing protein [Clostridium sp.]